MSDNGFAGNEVELVFKKMLQSVSVLNNSCEDGFVTEFSPQLVVFYKCVPHFRDSSYLSYWGCIVSRWIHLLDAKQS